MSGSITQRCDECGQEKTFQRTTNLDVEKPYRSVIITKMNNVEICDDCADQALSLLRVVVKARV